jgi:hypothetical protein
MAGASHQTVRLARGRHRSPREGACVMELASMLAGEPFSDRPRCADPVLATYLRAFNDRLSHAQRQRLRPYAAAVVGTRGGRRAAAARRRRCLRFACGHEHAGPLVRLRLAALVGLRAGLRVSNGAPEWAAREVIARGDVEAGFGLLDALLGPGSEPPALALPVAPQAQQRVPALTA